MGREDSEKGNVTTCLEAFIDKYKYVVAFMHLIFTTSDIFRKTSELIQRVFGENVRVIFDFIFRLQKASLMRDTERHSKRREISETQYGGVKARRQRSASR